MNIGDRIKQRRIELGLDATGLADRIGKSRATIYRYENGDIENMPTTVLEPIAKALNTTPAYLMGWESEKKRAEDMQQNMQQNDIGQLEAAFTDKEISHFKDYIQLTLSNMKKVDSYTKKLLSIQRMDDALEVAAAHERTDIEVTDEMLKHDNDIMDDSNF